MNIKLKRDVRPFRGIWKGIPFIIDLPGWYPDNDGESIHDSDDVAILESKLEELNRKGNDYASPTQKPPTERA